MTSARSANQNVVTGSLRDVVGNLTQAAWDVISRVFPLGIRFGGSISDLHLNGTQIEQATKASSQEEDRVEMLLSNGCRLLIQCWGVP